VPRHPLRLRCVHCIHTDHSDHDHWLHSSTVPLVDLQNSSDIATKLFLLPQLRSKGSVGLAFGLDIGRCENMRTAPANYFVCHRTLS
jgi:hypothetical protein